MSENSKILCLYPAHTLYGVLAAWVVRQAFPPEQIECRTIEPGEMIVGVEDRDIIMIFDANPYRGNPVPYLPRNAHSILLFTTGLYTVQHMCGYRDAVSLAEWQTIRSKHHLNDVPRAVAAEHTETHTFSVAAVWTYFFPEQQPPEFLQRLTENELVNDPSFIIALLEESEKTGFMATRLLDVAAFTTWDHLLTLSCRPEALVSKSKWWPAGQIAPSFLTWTEMSVKYICVPKTTLAISGYNVPGINMPYRPTQELVDQFKSLYTDPFFCVYWDCEVCVARLFSLHDQFRVSLIARLYPNTISSHDTTTAAILQPRGWRGDRS